MKIIVSSFLLLVILASCRKETLAPTVPVNETPDTTAVQAGVGTFISGPYGTTMGEAVVYKTGDFYQVQLTMFTVSNGPDLHVMLSAEPMPVNFIDLGSLKSTNGNQLYDIPGGMPDLGRYRFVSIHCVAYNHLFGFAEIN